MSDWMSPAGRGSAARAKVLDAQEKEFRKRMSNASAWGAAAIIGLVWFVACERLGAPGLVSTLPPLALIGVVAWNVELEW
jgi:hypothetical protein